MRKEEKVNLEKRPARRPIKSRNSQIVHRIAEKLSMTGITPNMISIFSVVFATLGGVLFVISAGLVSFPKIAAYFAVAICIQLRLLCNLFDGMVAIEGGKKTKSGELFNDFPDRIADLVLLVGAGYASSWFVGSSLLGWIAGSLAILTAYVRVLGASMGIAHDYRGPMAKQHRMALLTAGCIIACVEIAWIGSNRVIPVVLIAIIVGSFITILRRFYNIYAALERVE